MEGDDLAGGRCMRFALQLMARLLVGVLLAAIGSGCASRVEVRLDRGTDFSRYRTWGWQPREAPTGRARESALDVQVARQIQSALLDRGLHYVEEAPDLLVSASLLITRQQVTQHTTSAVRSLSSLHESGSFEIQVMEQEIQYYERGRLVVAVSDARQDREVWRGEVEGRYREAFRPHLDEFVAGLLRRFPMAVDPATGTPLTAVARADDAASGLSSSPRD